MFYTYQKLQSVNALLTVITFPADRLREGWLLKLKPKGINVFEKNSFWKFTYLFPTLSYPGT
jgi:hypothetical protein